ncbi:D-alanyl-D-alanine carboxypeptidase/D-alanyl-D-alanine-endopeptidase [soil metagenome]
MRTLLVSLSILLSVAMGAAQDLANAIKKITDADDYKHGRWGILIVDTKTGEKLYARNAETMFAPASVTKLYSCAAALTTLGADYKFETPVFAVGKIKEGELSGDLVLVAKGDLTFGGRNSKDGKTLFTNGDHTYADATVGGSELTDSDPLFAFKDLAKQVKAADITTINGDVLIDDRMFVPAEGSGSGPRVVSPMLANDNLIDFTVTPGEKPGDKATVTIRPQTAYLNNDIDVVTVEKGKASFNVLSHEPSEFAMRGSIAVGSKPIIGILPVRKPADFARTLFIEALKAEGVRVLAPVVRKQSTSELPRDEAYSGLKPVAVFKSLPFGEMITVTLKVSHNLYASTLPLLVANKKNAGKTLSEGLKAQGAVLKDLGVEIEAISFAGGAGGQNADHVTPRATVDLIQAMRKRPEWEVYKNALPVLGVDGTLATVVDAKSPAKGKVFAKTGTLSWTDYVNGREYLTSKALAGVMTTASGRELTLAMFVNDVPLPPGVRTAREGKALGKICEAIYENVK